MQQTSSFDGAMLVSLYLPGLIGMIIELYALGCVSFILVLASGLLYRMLMELKTMAEDGF